MRIICMSDLHIAEFGSPIWETDTTAHFNTAINIIRKIPSIDAIFISGDIADKGSQWAYDYVKHEFNNLRIPTYFIPGNHDNINNFASLRMSKWCHISKTVEIKGWKFIMLSSVLLDPEDANSNMGRGFLSDGELSLLKEELSTDSNVCLILHHPPIDQDGWLNRKLLENRDSFNQIVVNQDNIKMVIYGHTHYHTIKEIDGITYICSPSTGFAFNKDLPKFQIDEGAESLLIIDIEDTKINVQKVMLYE